jgi:hypothetical protein
MKTARSSSIARSVRAPSRSISEQAIFEQATSEQPLLNRFASSAVFIGRRRLYKQNRAALSGQAPFKHRG